MCVRTERTLVLVKPDGVRRRLVGEVVSRLERKGLRLCALKLMVLTREQAERHYAPLADRPFYGELISFITSGPVVAMVWEGPRAIQLVRQIMGSTDPLAAAPGSIRGDLGVDVEKNVVHGSDGPESAQREIANLFAPHELVGEPLPDEATLWPQD
jgi:nucleoside-diphosphate kinase